MRTVNNQVDTVSANPRMKSNLWVWALLWLLFLGPFFFISYGLANGLTSQNPNVSSIVFDWEHYIPFIPWTIIPYWIIDLLYGISLFICITRKELNRHVMRLLTAQVVAVICFIVFPLEYTFERPPTTGVIGWLFTTLTNFDQPYNQAPSLHITLLVILWGHYVRHLSPNWIMPCHILCMLIGISVLTTYQHHFIDIPTGVLLGCLCVWLWPLQGKTVLDSAKLSRLLCHWKIASYYLLGVILLTMTAFWFKGVALWLLWFAVSGLLVALNYLYFGSEGFQKGADGSMSMAAKCLYCPYLVGAYINSRLWTRKQPKAVLVCDEIYLGRFPARKDVKVSNYGAVVDMTAEFDKTYQGIEWYAIPSLDLLTPSKEDLLKAARLIIQLEQRGKILVTCALGYSRSALAIMAWLLITKRSNTVEDAIALVREQRPNIVISGNAREELEKLVQQ